MVLDYRPLRTTSFGDLERIQAPDARKALTKRRREFDAIVEYGFGVEAVDISGGAERLVGVLTAAFVTDAFARELERRPDVGIVQAVPEALEAGQNAVVRIDRIDEERNRHGLNLAWMHFAVDPTASRPDALRIIRYMAQKFYDLHGGYRLRTAYYFPVDEGGAQFAQQMGYRGPESSECTPGRLCRIRREEALMSLDLFLLRLFTDSDPVCQFTKTQRRLLRLAREGATDVQLSDSLQLSPETVKKHWAAIYRRAERALPTLFEDREGGRRGVERRRRLLGFLRDHPEEVRP